METSHFFLAMCLVCSMGAMAQTEHSSTIINSNTASSVTDTQYGRVCGYIYKGVYTYKGIPYAHASRFELPQAPQSWTGIRSCRTYGPSAPQPKTNRWDNDAGAFVYLWYEGRQSEDCLRLNIWTRGLNASGKRPVLVWLHGGGFVEGCGQDHPGYDGHNLAAEGDVVVVSINHRLNTLGYTDLSDYGEKYRYSGNVGNIDIVAALRWVKENIANFGGNPNCVTVFGQSGGGAKVSSLLCMPMAQGLFQRAMIMSGSGFMRGMNHDTARKIGRRTVELLGLSQANIDSIQKIDYATLYQANVKAMEDVAREEGNANSFGHSMTWEPVVDGDALPSRLFENGSERLSKDVPLIVGSTLNEFIGGDKAPKGVTTWEEAEANLAKTKGKKEAKRIVAAFRRTYPSDSLDALYRLDTMVRPAAVSQALTRASDGGAPVWNYLFCYHTPALDGSIHASHNTDIPFFFNNVERSANMTGATPEGIALGHTMSQALINFARTGKPYAPGLPEWKPVSSGQVNTMIWAVPACKLVTNHDKELMNY